MIDKYVIHMDYTVKKAIEKMTAENIKAVVVLDNDNRVCGLFSNGDMRNYFLRGGALSANISDAMNLNPHLYGSYDEVEKEHAKCFRVIYPIVDEEMRLIEVVDYGQMSINEKISDTLNDIPLVIMAGGKGTRLFPYTKILPKPLIPIGDTTITERIIRSFCRYGCKDVYMILNYKAGMIRAYMSDLDKDYNVSFVEEGKFLGTAGGLRLLKDRINGPFFLSNCDVLIDADFECILKTHINNKNKITFVCSMKDVIIPYGVVETNEDGTIRKMKEKPEFSYLVNTGLYLIESEVLDDIAEDEFIHLPDLAQRYIEKGERVGVFPISEKAWLDMGQFSEMEKMKKSLGIREEA